MTLTLEQYESDFSLFIRKNANKKYHFKHLPQKNLYIYAELIFNNINSALQGCFPICYEITDEVLWNNLVHAFIEEFKCTDPVFKDIPEQFLVWLKQKKHTTNLVKFLPKFFISFAHYEWVEMAIAIAPDNPYLGTIYPIEANIDIKQLVISKFIFSDAWTIVDYYYDMHLICTAYLPKIKKKSAQYYLIFRNIEGEVKFNLLSQLSVHIVSLLTANDINIQQSIEQILLINPHLDKQELLNNSLEIVKNLYEQGMILGIK